jgi:hypothetical protein
MRVVGVSSGGGELPVTSASPRSAWDISGLIGNTVNLVPGAPAPTSVYIALPQGPTNHISVGRPRSGRERGYRSAVGHDRSRDQPNNGFTTSSANTPPFDLEYSAKMGDRASL